MKMYAYGRVEDDRTSNFLDGKVAHPICNSDIRSTKFIGKINDNTSLKFNLYSAVATTDYLPNLIFSREFAQCQVDMNWSWGLCSAVTPNGSRLDMNWSWDLHSAVAVDGLPCRSNIFDRIPCSACGRYELVVVPVYRSRCRRITLQN